MAHGVSLRSLAKDDRPRETWSVVRRLLGYLRPYRRTIAVALFWLVLSSGSQAGVPAVIGHVIDLALGAAKGDGDASVLAIPLGALVLLTLLGWWAQRTQILMLSDAGQRALYTVREQVLEKVHQLSV
ncbi:MAG: hypothetical protein OEV43_03325, partial [Coriobacteriia bacterium]|nr:hypothetical protein [Coriobacteriia bacterium]